MTLSGLEETWGMITALSAKLGEGCVSVSMWHHHPCSRSPLSLPLCPNLLSMARVLKTFFFLELSTWLLSLLPCGASKSASYPKLEDAIFRLVFSSSLGYQPPQSLLFCSYRWWRGAHILLVSLPHPCVTPTVHLPGESLCSQLFSWHPSPPTENSSVSRSLKWGPSGPRVFSWSLKII